MKLGVLFSGGKDSCYALFKAMKKNSVCCLISVISKNPDSFMFHTPNIYLVEKQADAFGLPIILKETKGVKEEELKDLREVILEAKEKYGLDGIVTGAVASEYQKSRISKICSELGLKCVNPLWGMNQEDLMHEIVQNRFKFMMISVACDGLSKEWLGRIIYNADIDKLVKLNEKFGFNIAGEGGEFETLMVDGPIFKKEVLIIDASKIMENDYTGWYKISRVELNDKSKKKNFFAWSENLKKEGMNELAEKFDSNRLGDYEKLKKSDLPKFGSLSMGLTDFHSENNELMNFLSKYDSFAVRLIPKQSSTSAYKIGLKNFDECLEFFESEYAGDKKDYDISLIEHDYDNGAGIIICNGDKLVIELTEANLDDISYGKVVPVGCVIDKKGFNFNTNDSFKKELMMKALSYIKEGDFYKKGYFEFIVVGKDFNVKFWDYKDNELYWRKI